MKRQRKRSKSKSWKVNSSKKVRAQLVQLILDGDNDDETSSSFEEQIDTEDEPNEGKCYTLRKASLCSKTDTWDIEGEI